MQVVNRLASIWSIVDHNPVALSQTCIFGYFPGRHHQVAQQLVDKEHKFENGCEMYSINVSFVAFEKSLFSILKQMAANPKKSTNCLIAFYFYQHVHCSIFFFFFKYQCWPMPLSKYQIMARFVIEY